MELKRRGFLTGLGSLLLSPAIVKASSLMPLRGVVMLPAMTIPSWCPPGWAPASGHLVDRFQFPELHEWFKRTRQNGAHLSSQFRLPGSNFEMSTPGFNAPIKETMELHDGQRLEYLNGVSNPCNETIEVPLVAVKPMLRANGTVAQPGMTVNYMVNAEAIRASNPEANRIHEEIKKEMENRPRLSMEEVRKRLGWRSIKEVV